MDVLKSAQEAREDFYRNGVQFVQADIVLGSTFLEMACLEYSFGEWQNGSRSLYHASRAVTGASAALEKMPDLPLDTLATLQEQIDSLQAAVQAAYREYTVPN